jgi:hypothetical protein
MLGKRGRLSLVEVDAETMPKWLFYIFIIVICIVLLAAALFLGVISYSCIKGDCNNWGYYGMGFMGPRVMVYSTSSSYYINETEEGCWLRGNKVPCTAGGLS